MVSLILSTVSYTLALRAMAIGANLSCVRFGTWIDHLITEETQTWATNLTEKLNLMMRNSFVVIAKMIKDDFKWRGHVVPSDCNPVIWNFTRGWFITLTWPSIVVNKATSGKKVVPRHPPWIRLDRTGYRQVRYVSIILNFFFLGASYEVISLEKIVQFSARDRERSNKIPLVSCFSTCPFRSKIMGDSAAERFGKNPSNWMCISGLLHFRFHLLTWSSPQVTEIHIFMCYLEFFTPKILRR